MKTLVVRGRDPLPERLQTLIARGSTSVDEVSALELSTFVSLQGLGVDRIVFWAGQGDPNVRALTLNYGTAATAESRHAIIYVTTRSDEAAIDGMRREDSFVWPRDEDKLKIILTTGG